MKKLILYPQNLAVLGVPRRTPAPEADLYVIYRTIYPVLASNKKLCEDMRVLPYGGGSWQHQHDIKPGYITSGYRSEVICNKVHSPHRFALALDIHVGEIEDQIQWARIAGKHFCRVGLYPGNRFIHVDLCNKQWQEYYGGSPCWVKCAGEYVAFLSLDKAIEFAEDNNGNFTALA